MSWPNLTACWLITVVSLFVSGSTGTEANAQVVRVDGVLSYKKAVVSGLEKREVAEFKRLNQERAIAAIKGLGGNVEVFRIIPIGQDGVATAPKAIRYPSSRVTLRGPHITDAELRALEGLEDLRSLRLSDTRVTDAGIAKLRKWFPRVHLDRR